MGYYYLYPFFRTLLLEWGAEPVLSPITTRRMLERMDVCPTDEPCLAVKLHFSHAEALAHREGIDLLFLPVIARVEKTSCCPKFIGVSDMIRHGLRLSDERVAMPVLDYTDNDAAMAHSLRPLAERLGVRRQRHLLRGIRRAREAQERFHDLCAAHQLTTPEAFTCIERDETPRRRDGTAGPAVAVIGHPYLLYEAVSQDMVERLRAYGPVVTAEMVPADAVARAMATIKDGEQLWPFESMLLGAAMHLLRTRAVEKMILVGSFECGPESIIENYIEEEAHRQGIPFMLLALDEHAGEAGLFTRLEAFMDMEPSGHEAMDSAPPHVHVTTERVVAMPSMGHLDQAVRATMAELGIRMLPTPAVTPAIVELGRQVAPEFVCFPFTATLGQMRRVLDEGANTLLMVAGKGYCRLGWYAQIQEDLLRKLGYDFDMMAIESPFPLAQRGKAFFSTVRALIGDVSWLRLMRAVCVNYQRLEVMDRMERVVHRLRAFERERGTIDLLHARYLRQLIAAEGPTAIKRREREFLEAAAAIETEETDPLRIRILGEIWVVLESGATRDVECWLGMREHPRVWVDRELSTTNWFGTHVILSRPLMRREHAILDAARPWLRYKVGGHGQLTTGLTALAPHEGIDGVLHVFPFTCMPEIIAQNIMVRMSDELDIPILTYIVSEQTGEAGMQTRLESFLDLLEERRHARQCLI